MSRRGCRPFTILDASLCISAVAIGLAMSRGRYGDWPFFPLSHPGSQKNLSLVDWAYRMVESMSGLVFCLLFCLTVTFLAIRLRSPRPALRRILTQPGAQASLMVTILVSISLAARVAWARWQEHGGQSQTLAVNDPILAAGLLLKEQFQFLNHVLITSIVSIWLVHWLAGPWHPEPGWIDRGGRMIAVCWIGFMFTARFGWWWP